MSTEDRSGDLPARYKALLIGLAIVGLIGLVVWIIPRPGPCSGIVEQTAPGLEISLKSIHAQGSFAVKRERIQELDQGAQMVGVHLKACCTVLEGGKLDPGQFQQCIDKASSYAQRVALVAQQMTEVATAQERGATAEVREKVVRIEQGLNAATGDAQALARQVAGIKPSMPPAAIPADERGARANDSKENATELRLSGQATGEVSSAGDKRYYKLVPTRTLRDRVKVRLDNLSDTLFPELILYGPDKAELMKAYKSTPGANVELEYTAEPGAAYYLRVAPFTGSTGKYRIAAKYQNAADRYEPNDDPIRDKPTPLRPGQTLDANIMDEADRDWYLLAGAPSAKVHVQLVNRSGTLLPDIRVYDERRSEIQHKFDSTPGASLDFSFDATSGKTYYLQVAPYVGSRGAYQLTVN